MFLRISSSAFFKSSKNGSSPCVLERNFTKDEILTMYLNKFDFLYLAVGVKSAAKIYF